jgi:hypothetical protein
MVFGFCCCFFWGFGQSGKSNQIGVDFESFEGIGGRKWWVRLINDGSSRWSINIWYSTEIFIFFLKFVFLNFFFKLFFRTFF